ncbi:hypothetical protein P8625_04485 [Tenacibaculum tangerinum]|uniref:TonB C-terminal domain-containing protein n=1 Tax=Tenacibaculum tangerinum TaxID=3038772 RepID=A0ABY8L854_9FLAO|nr:hypothetical protein [Tenacibaculum tangerinum]WGH76425.1 hypothetical protein P8625_04485 [Tenacibaculum tangerinum]
MKKLFYVTCFILLFSCEKKKVEKNIYPRQVGDISYDVKLDSPNFILCNGEDNIFQYFNKGKGLEYKGGKKEIEQLFEKKYSHIKVDESGLIRIRFIVNCKGETGRFRVIQMNVNYEQFTFDDRIINQLLMITQSLDGWKIKDDSRGNKIDYYQYLIFKIEKGNLIEILP